MKNCCIRDLLPLAAAVLLGVRKIKAQKTGSGTETKQQQKNSISAVIEGGQASDKHEFFIFFGNVLIPKIWWSKFKNDKKTEEIF